MKQNEKATAAKFELAEQKIRQLLGQVSAQTDAKDDTEGTLTLFKAHTKELEDQKKELKSRFKIKSPYCQSCKQTLIRFYNWELLTLLLARRAYPRYVKPSRQSHMPISESFH